jgi:hypothetical protein
MFKLFQSSFDNLVYLNINVFLSIFLKITFIIDVIALKKIEMDKAAVSALGLKKSSESLPEYPTATYYQVGILCHRVFMTIYKRPQVPIATAIR